MRRGRGGLGSLMQRGKVGLRGGRRREGPLRLVRSVYLEFAPLWVALPWRLPAWPLCSGTASLRVAVSGCPAPAWPRPARCCGPAPARSAGSGKAGWCQVIPSFLCALGQHSGTFFCICCRVSVGEAATSPSV